MELFDHRVHFIGRVSGDIDSGGKVVAIAAKNDGIDLRVRLDIGQDRCKLLHHGHVNDIDRRIIESDARDWRFNSQSDAIQG